VCVPSHFNEISFNFSSLSFKWVVSTVGRSTREGALSLVALNYTLNLTKQICPVTPNTSYETTALSFVIISLRNIQVFHNKTIHWKAMSFL